METPPKLTEVLEMMSDKEQEQTIDGVAFQVRRMRKSEEARLRQQRQMQLSLRTILDGEKKSPQ